MSADNIVKASFVFGKSTKTRGLHQWDYGQVLQYEGLDLPAAYTVHFANQPMSGNAKTQVGGPDGVDIPDEYLTTGLPVYAWVYLHTGADDGETVYSVTIPVTKRPRPTEEPPTPQQQGAIDTAIAALNEGVETVQGIAEAIPQTIDAALEAAKESGEFDGPPGPQGERGETGQTGPQGVPGQDGVSPTATVTQTTTGATITVTDAQGTTTANIENGQDGQDGSPGAPGVSPTVTVTDITGGHRVTITDATGPHSFDVMDGDVADAPVQSVNGQTGAVVLDAQDVGAYEKPETGIPFTDMSVAVQTSLEKADTALQSAPVTSVNSKTGAVVLTPSDIGAGTYSKPSGGIPASDLASGVIPSVPVQDVQVNGTSVLSNGVAKVPVAYGVAGVVSVDKSSANCGIYMNSSNGGIVVHGAASDQIKAGQQQYRPIAPARQHESVFYGLAKAAGDTTQSQSSNSVGQYTDAAKDKIQQMLGIIDMIAPHEGAQAANQYSVGKAFCFAGKLYKATTAIAIGDAIAPGTNCVQTTLTALIGGN